LLVALAAAGPSFGAEIYWPDQSTDTIARANLDGSNPEDLITDLLNPNRGSAKDSPGGATDCGCSVSCSL